jgi:nitric oxide reductase NorD protein
MNESSEQKSSLTGLASKLSKLPADKRRAAVEVSAALAGVSLRVSREFVEAVPLAAKILSADDLRAWGELGRRLAMGSADTGSKFFAAGVEPLKKVPKDARGFVFQICTRQLVLSSSIALETFELIPKLADEIADDALLTDILKLAVDIANRSAKHSSDFLKQTPPVARELTAFGDAKANVSNAVITLAANFANRTGGMTADLWQSLPNALHGLSAENAERLATRSSDFLEHGGSVTLHFVSSGGDVLRNEPSVFEAWCGVLENIAPGGNAVLIAFLRATPKFFKQIAGLKLNGADSGAIKTAAVLRVIALAGEIAATDAESSLAAFRSSASALRNVSLDQYEQWIRLGLDQMRDESPKARRSYFALETRQSNDQLKQTRTGLQLESVSHVLRLYIEGLTGREIEIAPQTAMPQESRIGDGKSIYLPNTIAEFDEEDQDFRLYKVLAAYGAGQIEFGTFAKDTVELKAAFADLADLYSATAEQIDAFSLSGYIEDVQKGERALSDAELREEIKKRHKVLPKNSDYKAVLNIFPEPRLARKIFSTMENARIDGLLRHTYRGLRKDLDLMQDLLRKNRPFIFDVPFHQVPFELLFQITLCGGAADDARKFYSQIVSEIETVIEKHVVFNRRDAETQRIVESGEFKTENEDESRTISGSISQISKPSGSRRLGGEILPTVADSLFATSRIYNLFQNITPEQTQELESDEDDQKGEFVYDDKHSDEAVTEDQVKREERPQTMQDLRDLFNAWNTDEDEGEPDDLQGSEAWSQNEMPEQPLEAGDEAFAYDEWDRELNDYRVGWSRVIEKKVKTGDRNFVELARSRYRGVISSIRHQFQLMKPENLTKINRELDGEDYDLNALVDFVIDKRADGRQSENIYTKRLRKQRDVAVSLLLDQSSSTARTITRNPLQPYTYPGRRIIEIEKEGLVLMSEALEAVGDVYSINGFTSEGRRNVKFYVVKDFDEKYSDEIEKRIGGITFQNNTRLGAAIRHAAAKLLRQENRTKLLIILTDGRPYDHDYGDARYAREDVREALIEAKTNGITPFCITIDRESEAELRDLYGDVGYTIIDDVLSLPERMPNIYRRLTS